MKNVLGIGAAACKIVEQLAEYPVYKCYYISNEISKTSKFKFALKEQQTAEQYENTNMAGLHRWIEKIDKVLRRICVWGVRIFSYNLVGTRKVTQEQCKDGNSIFHARSGGAVRHQNAIRKISKGYTAKLDTFRPF